MKMQIRFLLVLLTIVGFALTNSSCGSDPCKDIVCLNGGIEKESGDDCICECKTGYGGEDCGELLITKYLGNYIGTEQCNTGSFSYSISITQISELEIEINNLYYAGLTTLGIVDYPEGNITIPEQSFGSGQISGSAKMLSSNTIELNFTVTYGGDSDSCVGVFSK